MNAKRVEVVPYSDLWPLLYEQEAERIRDALGSSVRVIEHVGSTAVPGLAAKPIIDIALSVESFDELDIDALEELGYEYVPEFEEELPNRRYFKRPGIVHLHAYEREHEEFLDYLRFREYMRTHAEDARDYGELKQRLAAQSERREEYQAAKAPYIARLVEMLRR